MSPTCNCLPWYPSFKVNGSDRPNKLTNLAVLLAHSLTPRIRESNQMNASNVQREAYQANLSVLGQALEKTSLNAYLNSTLSVQTSRWNDTTFSCLFPNIAGKTAYIYEEREGTQHLIATLQSKNDCCLGFIWGDYAATGSIRLQCKDKASVKILDFKHDYTAWIEPDLCHNGNHDTCFSSRRDRVTYSLPKEQLVAKTP